MATIFIEGFDEYGTPDSTLLAHQLPPPLAQGGWTVVDAFGDPYIVSPLSTTGYALQFFTGTVGVVSTNKTLPANQHRLIGGFRFNSTITGNAGIVFLDNNTPQCSIMVEQTSGFISVRQDDNGTTLALSSQSVAGNTNHYLEYDITIGIANLGGWTVWLDGVQIMSGVGTTQLTANNFANVVGFSNHSALFGQTFTVDDVYLFDGTTAFNNSVLLSNPAVITQFPIADVQKQFGNDGNVFGNSYSVHPGFYTVPANRLYLAKFTPNVNCTVNSIQIQPASTVNTANMKGVIYSDAAGVPNARLSDGTQVTGTVAGTQVNLPLVSPQALTAGTPYWIGFIIDSGVNFTQFGTANQGFIATNTYGSGTPVTAPAMTGGQASMVLFGVCTGAGTNWESEALNPPIGDLSSVSASVVATEDRYSFPALPSSVTTVYTVGVSGNARLSAPGTHTFDLMTLSGATSSGGSRVNIPPTINYAWYDTYLDVDPNTGTVWAPADVTTALHGMNIFS